MPKKFKPFEVMKETGALKRLSQKTRILYGPIGPPPDNLDFDGQVAWLDLVLAAPAGMLERSHKTFLELTARLLRNTRRGEADRGSVKLLGKNLRRMGLTPGVEPTPAAILGAFQGRGKVD